MGRGGCQEGGREVDRERGRWRGEGGGREEKGWGTWASSECVVSTWFTVKLRCTAATLADIVCSPDP